MPLNLLAEIDGEVVSLIDCDWVMWAPCGCPVGVTVARCTPTEDGAWREFRDRKRDIDRARRQGYRMELVTHARWGAEIMQLMTSPCPHKATGRDKAGA